MNKSRSVSVSSARQQGLALVISLLFLLVVTVISITAASNSTQGLKMSANLQDSYQSFQAAEAGIYAVLGQTGTAFDPLTTQPENLTPLQGVSPYPLANVTVEASPAVDLRVYLLAARAVCPRQRTESGGNSVDLLDCDYYRLSSEHSVPQRARTRVELGVVRTVLGERG
ncbi:MAG: PilX N-terminal domain-containing pilus assembly protein [Parahaliea sp.]